MPSVPYTTGLHDLGGGTFAYLQPPGTWGLSNAGLIVSGREAALVDTMFTLDLTARMLDTIAGALPSTRISTVVNTHPNGDHCWGNQLLPDAEIIATAGCAGGMAHEIPPAAMTAMGETTLPDSAMGGYMRRYFGDFDFGGIVLTPAARTFTGRLEVALGHRTLELIEVAPAHTDGDLVVHVPDAGVVFAGDILFIGDHPVMWTGPIDNWITACDTILATGARTIVPGHGPVTDPAGVREFRAYLAHVAGRATDAAGRGVPYRQAAAEIARSWGHGWGLPERLVVTVGTHYRHLGVGAPERAELIAAMADAYADGTP
jgi:cyclase